MFAFNFHPQQSYADYRLGVPEPADYRLVLNTDDPAFAGHGAVAAKQAYPLQRVECHARPQSVQIYLPARTALVLAPAGAEPA